MNIFKLSWDNHNEHAHWLYIHPNKTEDDFSNDCDLILKSHGQECINEEDAFVGMDAITEHISRKLLDLGYQYAPLALKEYSGTKMIAELDRKKLEPVLGKDLFDMAIKKNDAYVKSVYRQHKKRKK